ncbi:hypothetical protein NG791_12115 [Laspinema sp. D1]|uniref:hypothetical protein n=1 Tax=Laspinema palackyanum TaxID=3231601 RepID=UPI0034957E01|nr:hypothetical protein [Laspinema sp. D2b]
MSFVVCHLSWVDGEDWGDIQCPDISRYLPLFVVTTSVVTALLGIRQVTPMSGDRSRPQAYRL